MISTDILNKHNLNKYGIEWIKYMNIKKIY